LPPVPEPIAPIFSSTGTTGAVAFGIISIGCLWQNLTDKIN
jgi:hypothetical protein